MKRREFLKRLGLTAGGAGVVAAVGLPRLEQTPKTLPKAITMTYTTGFIQVDPVGRSRKNLKELLDDVNKSKRSP